jgi:exopolysaccharide biosynthesis operon protein EpsL
MLNKPGQAGRRWTFFRPAGVLCCALLALAASNATASPDLEDFLQLFVSDSFTYDDNIFRLSPEAGNPKLFLGPDASKADYINQASVGGRVHKALGRQVLDVDLHFSEHQYARNSKLDHASTKDSAIWKWALGQPWSGRVGADYSKSLAGFANTQFFSADFLTQTGYFFDARYQLNPHWSLNGGFRWSETQHSAASRQTQNIDTQTARGGIIYQTPRQDSLGLEYRHVDAQFSDRPPPLLFTSASGAVDNAYSEDVASFILKYNFSPKTRFEGSAGYLQRTNPHLSFRDFNGEIWRMSLLWTPTAKTQLGVSSWHEITAFAELASNFFVSEGVSLSPVWMPTEKLALSAQLRWETQDHAGGNGAALPGLPLRLDELFSVQAGVTYAPARFAEIGLTYQFSQRESNRRFFSFDDNMLNTTIKLKF